jgi:hypothetical protein
MSPCADNEGCCLSVRPVFAALPSSPLGVTSHRCVLSEAERSQRAGSSWLFDTETGDIGVLDDSPGTWNFMHRQWAGGESDSVSGSGASLGELESMGKTPPQLCIRFDGSSAGSGKNGRRHTTPERADKREGYLKVPIDAAVLSFLALEVTQMAAPIVGQKLQGAAWRKYWLTRARGHAIMGLIRCLPLSAG